MSHIALLVISKSPEHVEELLAPYQENNMGDCPKEYLQFHDVEDEYRKQYENDLINVVVGPRGGISLLYDAQNRNPDYDYSKPNSDTNRQYKAPEGSTEKELLAKELYTWDEYMAKYAGYQKNKETGKYGYWENPNAQWDWYVIGGRYRGRLKPLPGAAGKIGKAGSFDNPIDPGMVDQLVAKEVDWEGMRQKRLEDRAKWWAEYEAKAKKSPEEPKWAGYEYGVEEGDTRESYINKGEEFSVFAVLTKDGKWHERGSMGWWGCVSNEKDEKTWKKTLADLLATIEPDDVLTIVDCHI